MHVGKRDYRGKKRSPAAVEMLAINAITGKESAATRSQIRKVSL